jgi:ribosome-binding protein aMBF1 (putative translation factor)
MMDSADRDDELVAHTVPECTRLCKGEMMRIRRHAAAHEARLSQHESSVILIAQARAALGWGVRELAAAAKVSTDTVARFERGDELKERTIDALQRALEAAGIEFPNGDQPGVRLHQSRRSAPR